MIVHSMLGDFSASNPKLGSPTSVPLIPLFARDCIALQHKQIGCVVSLKAYLHFLHFTSTLHLTSKSVKYDSLHLKRINCKQLGRSRRFL